MPAIPSFLAYSTANQTGATGSGVASTVIFGNDSTSGAFDTTSNYNNSTGVFTAPFSGIYHFDTSVRITAVVTANIFGAIFLLKNGSTAYDADAQNVGATKDAVSGASGTVGLQHSMTLALNANDTMAVQVYVSGNGTPNVGILGNTTSTYFNGFLVR